MSNQNWNGGLHNSPTPTCKVGITLWHLDAPLQKILWKFTGNLRCNQSWPLCYVCKPAMSGTFILCVSLKKLEWCSNTSCSPCPISLVLFAVSSCVSIVATLPLYARTGLHLILRTIVRSDVEGGVWEELHKLLHRKTHPVTKWSQLLY